MLRITWLAAGLAVMLTLGVQTLARADDDDWKDYQKRIEQSRKETEKRYESWQKDQEKRNQTWLDAKSTERDRVLELPNSGLKPGNYTVRLPFGLGVRINVPNSPQGPSAVPAGPPAWGNSSYGDVHYRARQITTQVRDLQIELQRTGQTQLTGEAAKIYEQAVGVSNSAANRRPATEIRSQFAEFDQLWHPFSHRLARQTEVGASVQRRVSAIDQLEEGLHQTLRISPAPPYDRPLVAALTSELVQTTNHLLEDLQVEPKQTFELQSITIRAQRVKQQAIDLDATVRQNAAFATIVEEYEEFDRAWHRLQEQAQASATLDAHVRRVGRELRQIDQQLHNELYVNVPMVNNRQQMQQRAAGIAKTAAHLADDLDADVGRGQRELLYEARLFASVSSELSQVLADRQSAQVEQKAFKDLAESWNRLSDQINLLSGERFEHSRAIAVELANDVQRLFAQRRS